MFRLVLLGGLRLEDDAGPVAGRASQKRRLALLTLLAVPPGCLLSRDKLVGYLWPDRADERARSSLSTALYDLRQELGGDAIQAPGDDLRLNPEVVTSDVAEFLSALDADDLEAAVEGYTGPFLEGAYVGGGSALEQWIDGERRRLARRYHEALEALATRRAERGDARGAADAWRRLANETPYSKRVALGYMRALLSAGDRARAIQFADVHAALMREEYDAEPDPEVMALAERLRRQPPAAKREDTGDGRPAGPEAASTAGTPAPDAGRGAERATGDLPPRAGSGDTEHGPPGSSSGSPSAVSSRPGGSLPALGRLVVPALLVLLGVVLTFLRDGSSAAQDTLRLAVLPLENLGEASDDYFALGLTEELNLALSQVGGLSVPGPTSSLAYRNAEEPAPQVARELGVDYLLRGTVRRYRDQQRTIVRLLDAEGDVFWSQAYDSRRAEDLAVQARIARDVADELRPRLSEAPSTPAGDLSLLSFASEDPAARDHYLRARAHWYRRSSPRSLQAALEHYQRALALDSTYARAWVGIADVLNAMGAYEQGMLHPDSAYPRAMAAARRALRLEPDLAEAHAALGVALFNYGWRWDAAREQLVTALDLNPGDSMTRHWLSLLLRVTGDTSQAHQQIAEAVERDPSSAVIATSQCRHLYFDREAGARAACQRAIELDSSYIMAYLMAGLTAVQQGRPREALDLYEKARELLRQDSITAPVVEALSGVALAEAGDTAAARALYRGLAEAAEGRGTRGGTYVPPQFVAVAAIGAGRDAEAVTWLERALDQRSAAMIYLGVEPLVDPLRGLPAFTRLLDRARAQGLDRVLSRGGSPPG